jgi:hypothetical protein
LERERNLAFVAGDDSDAIPPGTLPGSHDFKIDFDRADMRSGPLQRRTVSYRQAEPNDLTQKHRVVVIEGNEGIGLVLAAG